MTTPRLVSDARFAAIDFESAGAVRGQTDVPVQVGWAIMEQGTINPDGFFRSYLSSDRPITWAAQKAHGITLDDLQGAPRMLDLWTTFRSALRERVMVAHGIGTEQKFLRAFPMHGFGPWVDTLQLARSVYPGLESYALGDLLATCQLTPQVDALCPGLRWHDALYDAVGSLVFLQHVIREADLDGRPLETLLHG